MIKMTGKIKQFLSESPIINSVLIAMIQTICWFLTSGILMLRYKYSGHMDIGPLIIMLFGSLFWGCFTCVLLHRIITGFVSLLGLFFGGFLWFIVTVRITEKFDVYTWNGVVMYSVIIMPILTTLGLYLTFIWKELRRSDIPPKTDQS